MSWNILCIGHLQLCHPILDDGTNCSDSKNIGKYIENFKCLGDTSDRLLKEVHLSFPSGHSSFSMFTMLYCTVSIFTIMTVAWSDYAFSTLLPFQNVFSLKQIYLQSRMTWRGSKLFKHFLQYLMMMMAWFTCMSRISDYKHHWSDVLAGGLIGATFAIITVSIAFLVFIFKFWVLVQSDTMGFFV